MFFENWNFWGSWSFKIALKVFKKFNFLKYYGTKISIFQWGIKIFGPKCSYFIFEVVNFWGFWGPEAMRGNNFKEKKVVPLIFTQFWIRSHLNQLDRLTPHLLRSISLLKSLQTKKYFFLALAKVQWMPSYFLERQYCCAPL